jgi:hypothetical protein
VAVGSDPGGDDEAIYEVEMDAAGGGGRSWFGHEHAGHGGDLHRDRIGIEAGRCCVGVTGY